MFTVSRRNILIISFNTKTVIERKYQKKLFVPNTPEEPLATAYSKRSDLSEEFIINSLEVSDPNILQDYERYFFALIFMTFDHFPYTFSVPPLVFVTFVKDRTRTKYFLPAFSFLIVLEVFL